MEKMNKSAERESQDDADDLTKLYAIEGSDDDDEDTDGREENDVLGNAIDEDDEILSDEAGELEGGLDDLPIFNRERAEEAKDGAAVGKALHSQFDLYDQLVQSRIRIQKLLSLAAQLPFPSDITEFNKQSAESAQNKYLEVQEKLQTVYELGYDILTCASEGKI